MQMKILLTDKHAWPSRAHEGDAGLDLKSTEPSFMLGAKEKKLIGTGVHVEIPKKHFGMLVIRSGLGTKTELEVANKVGIIDSDYRGEIMAMIRNTGDVGQLIEQYAPIVQLILVPCLIPEIIVVDKLSETKRGTGGFGHTSGGIVDNKSNVVDKVEAPLLRRVIANTGSSA